MSKFTSDSKMDSVNLTNIDVFHPPYIDDHPKEEVLEDNEVIVVEDDDDEREDVQIDEELPSNWIPKSDNMTLTRGPSAVLALACDPLGYRLATGSSNGQFRLWDFATLDTPDSYFCRMMPCDNNPIKGVQYSKDGDHILVVSSGVQAVILDRDGFEVAKSAKSLSYQYDIADTRGHVGPLNCGAFNPQEKNEYITCSTDGTSRIWRTDWPECHKIIVEHRSINGHRTIPTYCCYSNDGRASVVACLDGSLQIWDTHTSSMRPSLISENAHRRNEDICCVTYSHGGNLLGTRSRDTTLKLFDIRWFGMPVHSRAGLHCGYSETNCIFSPCDSMIATATSSNGEFGHGNVKFFDVNTFQMVNEIVTQDTQVIQILWQPKINQIMLGCENGSVQLYYDKKRSLSGAKYFAAKMKKKTKQLEVRSSQEITEEVLRSDISQDMPGSVGKQIEKDHITFDQADEWDFPITAEEAEPVQDDAVPSTSCGRGCPSRRVSVNLANIDDFYRPYIDDHPKEIEEDEGFPKGDDEDNGVEVDEELPPNWIPKSDNLALTHGKTAVLALACDPFGYRLATGSSNGHFRLWDFATLDTPDSYFCTMMPCDNNHIKGVQYSKDGDRILVVSSSAQAVILDQDGIEVAKCANGYGPMLKDCFLKGHVGSLNCAVWSPIVTDEFMTIGNDCTCRIWRSDRLNCNTTIIKTRSSNGLKTIPTSCCYSKDGSVAVVACRDGSLQIFDARKASMRPSLISENAHRPYKDISCVIYSYGGNLMGSRSRDTTLKLFDIRWFDMPVHSRAGLHCGYSETNCIFSPCDSMIATATSSNGEFGHGNVKFFDVNTFQMVNEIVTQDTQVIQILWQPKINQIMLGCENGSVQLYYDKKRSLSGAKYFAAKMKKKTKQVEVVAAQQIITPHSLPIFRQDKPKSVRKQMEKDRMDPTKSHRPNFPITAGQGGSVAASGGTCSSYVFGNLGLHKRVEDDQDPMEAILCFAQKAAENPYWVSPAYTKTQPNTIFQRDAQEHDDEEDGGNKA